MAFNPVTLLARARRLYNVETSQWSDVDALNDLNELKNNFQSSLICAVEEDWHWETWTSDTVALQSEYTLPSIGASTSGAKQIKELSICYDGETYKDTGEKIYIPCTEVNPNTLQNHWGWYKEFQPTNDPLYFISDNSVFISPVPRSNEAGTNMLELRGIKSVPDYTLSTTEAEMKFPVDVQQLFVQGLEPYAMRSKGMDRNDVNASIIEYERLLTQKIKEMTTRHESADFFTYPE